MGKVHFEFDAKIKHDAPMELIGFLVYVIHQKPEVYKDSEEALAMFGDYDLLNHDFFKCERWEQLLTSTDGGTVRGGKIMFLDGHWNLKLETEFKNYFNEVELFLKWISPFLVFEESVNGYIGMCSAPDLEWDNLDEADVNRIFLEKPKTYFNELYCIECGEDQKFACLGNYANGKHFQCKTCGHKFMFDDPEED